VERERQRQAMAERYRSMLGHLRHESGHYYWMLLIEDTGNIAEFRGLFGDERADYRASLNRHHEQGPRTDWSQHHVSAYASAHRGRTGRDLGALHAHGRCAGHRRLAQDRAAHHEPFGGRRCARCARPTSIAMSLSKALVERWVPLTLALNEINRSMGHNDFYPFVITPGAETKLRFVHTVIRQATMAPAIGKRMM